MKKILICLLIISGLVSCTNEFEEINTNPLYPDDEQKSYDGVGAGAYFIDFQKRVIPTRGTEGEGTDLVNRYQIAVNLAGDNWVGYLSPMDNKFNNGVNFTTYYMIEGWVNYAYSTVYTNIVNPWVQIKDQTHEKIIEKGKVSYKKKSLSDQALFSVAQIIKIMGLQRATDVFGPIPYTKIGTGDLMLPYDKQEVIYKSFFEELQEAVKTLNDYIASGGSSIESLKDFDAVYQGNVEQWVKLANSLMLRLAVRVRYVDNSLSEKWAKQAVENKGGLIESTADIAKLESGGNHTFLNSLEVIWNNYNDCRIGATLACYLKGYNDPRIEAYCAKYPKDTNPFELNAIRTGIPKSSSPDLYINYSIPNIYNATPVYWFKASEVFFLKAEAALYNLISGDAKSFYEKGIETSFAEQNVSSSDYINSGNFPADYQDKVNSVLNASAPSTVTVKWDNGADAEVCLEKIITQKYIALFPDGQEAWTEWRRTGYPKQIPAKVNRTDGVHGNVFTSDGYKYGVRRMPFPQSEYTGMNRDNVLKACALLSTGIDDSNARLWWDANPKLD